MKKFLGMFLSLMLSLSLFSSYTIFAQDNTKYLMKESSVQQISKDGNIIINNESYIVSNSQLKNSIFEGERVVVQSDGIYVNGTRASDQVQVTIGGVVVGWIIDGIMMYAVGYNVDAEAVKKWIANGAQPTDTVKALLKKNGIIE